jgi:hypothetical protein
VNIASVERRRGPIIDQKLMGKLVADKGYSGKELAGQLLRRGLVLCTRVGKNMTSLPLAMIDQMLLNTRHLAETIIGHIKAFSSPNLPKHRAPINVFLHLLAALTADQINPYQTLCLLLSALLAASIKNPLSGFFSNRS